MLDNRAYKCQRMYINEESKSVGAHVHATKEYINRVFTHTQNNNNNTKQIAQSSSHFDVGVY